MGLSRLIRGILGESRVAEGRAHIQTREGEIGAVVHGPYEQREPGNYRVEFEIGSVEGAAPLGDPVAVRLDVCTNEGGTMIAERFLLSSQITPAPATYSLNFELQEQRTLEYRIAVTGKVAVSCSDEVRVTRVAAARKLARVMSPQERNWRNEREFLDGYLRNVTGLIHVGANLGQERRYYWLIGLDVVWVEPIREIYDGLVDRLAQYPRQRAINALLAAKAGESVEFQIANNNGASSSILALQDHAVIFPDVSYVERREIVTTTLDDMVRDHAIPLEAYQALTLDVEGAEQLVLQGAGEVLSRFQYVKCEVADFPARAGTPTVRELDDILRRAGFEELSRRPFADGPDHRGTFWDVVWKKVAPGQPLHEPGYALPIVFNAGEVIDIEKCE